MIILVMGVSGVGKSTVGKVLARRLGWRFFEGDDYHPDENVKKMNNGIPLDDSDRRPWLLALRRLLDDVAREKWDAVITCSALKQSYRDFLSEGRSEVRWVYLFLDVTSIRLRLKNRSDHFMPSSLLDSQLTDLEQPTSALRIDASGKPDSIVEQILVGLDLESNF
ncbi:MAG: AAA family ATPase [Gammaproteobacteria bacterium]|nr:AAA family ATPase [Gammaproteobacteria bacterium]